MWDLQAVCELMLTPTAIALVIVGSTLGVVVGAIPGLTGAMLIALSLPLTFSMSGEHALILLVSMYVGSITGGLITATLLRIPGTPASIMTTLDGYPMACRGEADRALGLGVGASLFGGLVSWGFLLFLAGPMAHWSLMLGPFDFFALILVALVTIATVTEGAMIAGLFSGFLGMLAAMPGASPATGQVRWTFGFPALDDGLKLLPVLIGMFAVNQVIRECLRVASRDESDTAAEVGVVRISFRDWRPHWTNLWRSSFIGTVIGILPGIGANIGSVIAYAAAKRASSQPEAFGTGSEEGVVASEAANNATVGGALIPLIAMGIPGSVIDAILLGALVIHGLQPGPLLIQQNPLSVQAVIATVLLANLFVFFLMTFGIRWIGRAARQPRWILIPSILTCCVVGSYALANRFFDVWVMLAFGLFGALMERFKIPLAPFVIGFVLAPLGEEHLGAGLMQSGGSYWPLITRPISAALLFVSAVLLTRAVWNGRGSRRQDSDAAEPRPGDDSRTGDVGHFG